MPSRSRIASLGWARSSIRAGATCIGVVLATVALAIVALPARGLVLGTSISGLFANGPVYALARAADGSIYVGGNFTQICSSSTTCDARPRIAHVSAEGKLLPALGSLSDTSTNGPVRALAVAADGSVYAGGEFGLIGGTPIGAAIARWDGSAWQPLRSGLEGSVFAIAALGPDVYVGGDFTGAAGTPYPNVARWDGANWQPLGLGASGKVLALTAAGTSILAGGSFSRMTGAASGTARIARWDGATWQPLGKGLKGTYDAVRAIAVAGRNIYAGGSFTTATAKGQQTANIARYDGKAWRSLGTGANGPVNALALTSGGLYAGGDFTSLGTVRAQRVAAWNGAAWRKVGAGANATVHALAAPLDGQRLFVGGSFTRIAGSGHTNLAAFLPPPKRLLATEWAPSKVDYYAGVAIWSRYDPKTTRYRLVMARGGKITTLPVRWRYVPFDVDLGPGPDGRVRAVYSRCVREPGWSRGYSYLPLWTRGRGCDIYIYDFRSGREHRLRSVSTPGASEFLPALWRDRIAFVRVYQGRTGPQRVLPYLYVGRLGKRGAWRRAPGGARGVLGTPGPTGLDLYGRNLAFTWGWAGANREDRRIEVRLDTIGVRHTKLIGTAMGPTWRAFYLTPAFDRGRLFWGEACYGDTEPCRGRRGEVMSYRLGSLGDYFQGALGADQEMVALARDGGRLLVMRSKTTPGGARTCAERSAPLPPAGRPQCEVILDADVTLDPFAGPGA